MKNYYILGILILLSIYFVFNFKIESYIAHCQKRDCLKSEYQLVVVPVGKMVQLHEREICIKYSEYYSVTCNKLRIVKN